MLSSFFCRSAVTSCTTSWHFVQRLHHGSESESTAQFGWMRGLMWAQNEQNELKRTLKGQVPTARRRDRRRREDGQIETRTWKFGRTVAFNAKASASSCTKSKISGGLWCVTVDFSPPQPGAPPVVQYALYWPIRTPSNGPPPPKRHTKREKEKES